MNGTLAFCECRLSGVDPQRWWGHSNPTRYNQICVNFLHLQAVGILLYLWYVSFNSERAVTLWNILRNFEAATKLLKQFIQISLIQNFKGSTKLLTRKFWYNLPLWDDPGSLQVRNTLYVKGPQSRKGCITLIEKKSLLCDILPMSMFVRCVYVSLRLRVQNAGPAEPCVGKYWISLILLNFLHCNFRLWFKTP